MVLRRKCWRDEELQVLFSVLSLIWYLTLSESFYLYLPSRDLFICVYSGCGQQGPQRFWDLSPRCRVNVILCLGFALQQDYWGTVLC